METVYNFRRVRKEFSSPYLRPPVVYLGVVTFANEDHKTYFSTELVSVDELGFEMKCIKYKDPDWQVFEMDVSWISVVGG